MNDSYDNKFFIKLRNIIAFGICFLFISLKSFSQDSILEYKGFMLSSVLIADMEKGFDIDKFILRIQNDTTFYKAFKSLKLLSFTQYNDFRSTDKSGETLDSYSSISRQKRAGNCRTMLTTNIKHSKDYFNSNNEPELMTAGFYHRFFIITSKLCNENNIVSGQTMESDNSRVNQLKTLIFKPGEAIDGVPGIGSKLGIFEDWRMGQYNFTLSKELYNSQWCYVFKAEPKAAYRKKNVINYLHTWFRVSDHAIVARNYSLSYKTMLYDFDVEMKVKLKTIGKLLAPYEIFYNGDWHFVGKKRERCNFSAILTDFE